MKRHTGLLSGIAVGVVLTYLFDPERGKRRRQLLVDRMVHLGHDVAGALDVTARDAANRSSGLLADARGRFRLDLANDAVLVDRVRSRMGRYVSHPGSIDVTARHGRVTLRGPILKHEVEDLLAAVADVEGVTEVNDELSVREHAGTVPGLQGGIGRTGEHADLLQQNWSPTTRFLAGTAGGALVFFGATHRNAGGVMLGLAGLGLLTRAMTNLGFRRLTGIGAGQRAVDVQKTITVAAPVEEVFQFWSQLENFPRFMEHVREVRDNGHGQSHWTVTGPAGTPASFDVIVTKAVPNAVLAWKTVPGAVLQHAGIIRFEPEGPEATRLHFRMSYNPPAGAIGHAIAACFGGDPKQALDEDLVRFKSLIEQGKATVHGETVTRTELSQAQQP